MIGIYPGKTKTFIVEDCINNVNDFIEGHLYVDEDTDLLYIYSSKITRPNVEYGFFPIFDGKNKYVRTYCILKTYKDVINQNLDNMISNVDDETKNKVDSLQRNCSDQDPLKPIISDSDNAFTQCIKSIIDIKKYTLSQLEELCSIDKSLIKNYYSVLNKISFMRLDRFNIWMKSILHMNFKLIVKDNNGNKLVTYDDNLNKFDTGIISYNDIVNNNNIDFMKKIIFIVMRMKSITKSQLSSGDMKDYTVNNLLILLNSNKQFSIQLFSRFIKMIDYSYNIEIYDKDKLIFIYSE